MHPLIILPSSVKLHQMAGGETGEELEAEVVDDDDCSTSDEDDDDDSSTSSKESVLILVLAWVTRSLLAETRERSKLSMTML